MSQLGWFTALAAAIPKVQKAVKDVRSKLKQAKQAEQAGNIAAASLAQKDAELIAAKQAAAITQQQKPAASQIPMPYIIGGVAVLGLGAILLMKKR